MASTTAAIHTHVLPSPNFPPSFCFLLLASSAYKMRMKKNWWSLATIGTYRTFSSSIRDMFQSIPGRVVRARGSLFSFQATDRARLSLSERPGRVMRAPFVISRLCRAVWARRMRIRRKTTPFNLSLIWNGMEIRLTWVTPFYLLTRSSEEHFHKTQTYIKYIQFPFNPILSGQDHLFCLATKQTNFKIYCNFFFKRQSNVLIVIIVAFLAFLMLVSFRI